MQAMSSSLAARHDVPLPRKGSSMVPWGGVISFISCLIRRMGFIVGCLLVSPRSLGLAFGIIKKRLKPPVPPVWWIFLKRLNLFSLVNTHQKKRILIKNRFSILKSFTGVECFLWCINWSLSYWALMLLYLNLLFPDQLIFSTHQPQLRKNNFVEAVPL